MGSEDEDPQPGVEFEAERVPNEKGSETGEQEQGGAAEARAEQAFRGFGATAVAAADQMHAALWPNAFGHPAFAVCPVEGDIRGGQRFGNPRLHGTGKG